MKYGDYSKLVHSNPKHKDWFVVNWCLGNTCNFSCSYCPEGLHNGSLAWPKVEDVKSFITKVIEQIAPKKVYFEFTGGEVTLMKNFIDRFSYIFHRPRFFDKKALLLSTTGALGLKEIFDYLAGSIKKSLAPAGIAELMNKVGLSQVTVRKFSVGIVSLVRGIKRSSLNNQSSN